MFYMSDTILGARNAVENSVLMELMF
jgi:hypothetical protein